MIDIKDKKDCCGCNACVQKCPRACISMKEDEEGFLYPFVNQKLCIHCDWCDKVCPIINKEEPKAPLETFAVKNRNEKQRMNSSSGGVFIALAIDVVKKGGVVFGAVFDKEWEVRHTYAETEDGLVPMMGSKYMQSRIENTFKEVEAFLKTGRIVLFVGASCQIAGLHKFLQKKYDNLLSVDFLCHGVSSPGIWRKYLIEVKRGISLSPIITSINFRDKSLNGWRKYGFIVEGKPILETNKNIVLLSETFDKNPFMKGFLADLYLRLSCYQCLSKNGRSGSDLTIGDYWSINKFMPSFDDDKGVGLVLINNKKGKSVFESLDMETKSLSVVDARIANGGFSEYLPIHPKRDLFYADFEMTDAISSLILKTLKDPFLKKIKKELLGKMHKFVRTKLS